MGKKRREEWGIFNSLIVFLLFLIAAGLQLIVSYCIWFYLACIARAFKQMLVAYCGGRVV